MNRRIEGNTLLGMLCWGRRAMGPIVQLYKIIGNNNSGTYKLSSNRDDYRLIFHLYKKCK